MPVNGRARMNKNRRRNFFIKKELQGRYMFSYFIFIVAGGAVFTGIFWLLSAKTMTIAYENYSLRLGVTPKILFKEFLYTNWIALFVSGLTVVVASMFLTHRFAGPLYRLEKSVGEMMKGNFDFNIKLRKRDEGKELADMINRFNGFISQSLKEVRHLSGEIERELAEASLSTALSEKAGEVRGLEGAIALNRRIGEALRNFKLKNGA
jgi:methyl-accepting chemotaxis protein